MRVGLLKRDTPVEPIDIEERADGREEGLAWGWDFPSPIVVGAFTVVHTPALGLVISLLDRSGNKVIYAGRIPLSNRAEQVEVPTVRMAVPTTATREPQA